ncbi:Rrf2 family transcriptional regulator [Paenibacillus flagellatus]|uniref:Transcriptional regulator n=1 Tax=Paenibacillus flagellatus TaxID=2211139 RepID=A0A2V5JUZ8_9BACL|nr:Rrf2 family transcriptional regulator [Paenibacillus flagellatus]PYI50525.1 transcriptional regulator [Paenibacillus flagellatus]
MKFSKATNYALHTMLYLVAAPAGKSIGVRPLAEFQNVSPTYLSKILTQLVKAGLIASTPGVHGGYRLAKSKDAISFLDIIQAVEGTASLFECGPGHDAGFHEGCLIRSVMARAEDRMERYLQEQKLIDLVDRVDGHMLEFIRREAQ